MGRELSVTTIPQKGRFKFRFKWNDPLKPQYMHASQTMTPSVRSSLYYFAWATSPFCNIESVACSSFSTLGQSKKVLIIVELQEKLIRCRSSVFYVVPLIYQGHVWPA